MKNWVVGALALAYTTAMLAGWPASANDVQHIKIGVLTDMSGAASSASGRGSVIAAQLAIDDYAKRLLGDDIKIELVQADHQNNPDIASGIARKWVTSEGVDAVVDVPYSSASLAVSEVIRASGQGVMLASGAGTADLTGSKCSPRTIQWTYDTWSVGHSTARAVTQAGLRKWFILTADFAFGHSLETEATAEIKAQGGTVVGTARHPFGQADFSSYLLQAQASGADVIGLANSVTDTVNSIKQAREFGVIAAGQKLAALIMLITDVNALGLEAAQGLYLTEPFYWDMNDGTRKFSDRFTALMPGQRPSMIQAGVYSVVAHYLKAIAAAKTTDGLTVIAKMKEMPTDDPLFGQGKVRVDGRTIHNMYLFQVKSPEESKGPWDYYKLVKTIPGDEAFRPLADGGCPLVK
jgi:branched-chain amino acid transport system substrate-binding protein